MKKFIILFAISLTVLFSGDFIKVVDVSPKKVTFETAGDLCTVLIQNDRLVLDSDPSGCTVSDGWIIIGGNIAISKSHAKELIREMVYIPSRANGVIISNTTTIRNVEYSKDLSEGLVTLVFINGEVCDVLYLPKTGTDFTDKFKYSGDGNSCRINEGARHTLSISPKTSNRFEIFGEDLYKVLLRDTYE